MSLRRPLLIPVLVLAVLQSLGHAHCAWMSMGAACATDIAAARSDVAAPSASAPAAAFGHDCCGHEDADTPAVPASSDAKPADDCTCPCMHQPVATATSAVVLSGPGIERHFAFAALLDVRFDAALAFSPGQLAPTGSPPFATRPQDPTAPRGPPTLA